MEAASTGTVDRALAVVPPPAQAAVADVAGQGYLAGLNGILLAGAALSFIGAVLATWLIRDLQRHELDRLVHSRPGITEDDTLLPAGSDAPHADLRRVGARSLAADNSAVEASNE